MRRTIPFFLLAAMLMACEDTVAPERAVPADLDVFVPELARAAVVDTIRGSGDRPAAGEETDWGEAWIISSTIEAGFRPNYGFSQAAMEFWATEASIDLSMTLRYGNQAIGSGAGQASFVNWLPWRERINTSATVGITGACGHIVDANAIYDVKNRFQPDGIVLTSASISRPAVAQQPACVPPDPTPVKVTKEVKGGGDNDEDSDWYICYYTYYYSNVTGALLYTEFHGCQPL